MAVDKKNRIKRVVLTWLCVAALVSGAVPDSFSGYVPSLTMAAAAEDQQTYVSEIDLQQIVKYEDGTTAKPTGVRIYNDGNRYTLWLDQSGTYKLKGSNYINSSYVDVTILCNSGVNATIICDDVYIKNDFGNCFPASGPFDNSHSFVTPFDANGSTMTISGNVAVETYFCQTDNYSAPLTYGNVNGSFCTVTYKDANGNTIGSTHYLSGSTYSDKSGITDGKCLYTMDGEGNKTAFSQTTITSDITVYCADHSFGEDGVCTVCGVKYEIDLTKLPEYEASGGSIFDGKVSVRLHDNNGSPQYSIYFNETGSYKIKGSNYINDCYCDVQFYSLNGADVTLVCDDVYIRNDDGTHEVNVCGEGYHTNTITPFNVGSGSMKLTGKLAVDTFCCSEGDKIIDFKANDVNADYFAVTYQDENGKTIGKSYYLTGSTYSDKSDITDGKCSLYTMDGEGNKTDFSPTTITSDITVYCADHSPDANGKCQNCGVQFRDVTVDDGINTPSTYRVADNDTFDRPADPTAPLGKKFAGWYVGDTEYDFSTPVTSDIIITAHYEDSLIKSVELAPTPNVVDEYIEGNKFDPTGLVIEVTYEDNRTETITYSENNTKFSFSPALTEKLATTDRYVTVSYGTAMQDGSNSDDIPITVAAKQLDSIAVKTAPTKTEYIEGNTFDPTGLVITLTYDNGDSEDVAYSSATASDFTFNKTELALGDTAVQITYGGKSVEQTITVAAKQLTSIAVKTAPTKVSYIEGNTFDPTGLVITLHYDNNTTEDVIYNETTASDFTFNKTELALGDSSVQITYGGKSVEQTITVAAKQLTSVTVKTAPTKVSYIEGNDFDPTGLVITLHYDNNTTADVTYNATTASDFTFDKTELALGDTAVQITYGGKSVEQTITVAAKQLTSIAVKTAPKTTYIEGNTFDPTGLVITASYNNGKSEDIAYTADSGITFSLTGELATTDTKVTITYGGKSVDQTITVAEKQLTSVTVKTAPTKITYIEGNTFDPTGLVITLTYDNGDTDTVTYSEATKNDFTFDKTVLATADTAVTITYGGKTAAQTITVANKQVTDIAIKTAPTKTAYIEGEKFNPAGLVITASYNNGKSEDIAYSETSGITFTPTGELTTADTRVTITYGGKTAAQTITVAEKQLTAIAIKTAPTKTAYIEGNKFDPTGLVITASYDNGKSEDIAYSETSGITFAPTAELTTADTKVTITYNGSTAEQAITVSKKSSGGSSGGSSRPSRPTTPTNTNPVIGGSAKSWSDVAADLAKLTNGSEATIELNGNTTIPADVIKAIADKDSKVTLAVDNVFNWVVDGSKITTPAAADLTLTKTTSTKSDSLRGVEGTQFKINGTNIPTNLEIAFKSSHAGKFANLYKSVDGKLEFVTCAKLGEDGKVILTNVTEKGEYVVMLCEFSDRPGDMDNDGIINPKDSLAVLKNFLDIEKGANPLVSDVNKDGFINPKDALIILKKHLEIE